MGGMSACNGHKLKKIVQHKAVNTTFLYKNLQYCRMSERNFGTVSLKNTVFLSSCTILVYRLIFCGIIP